MDSDDNCLIIDESTSSSTPSTPSTNKNRHESDERATKISNVKKKERSESTSRPSVESSTPRSKERSSHDKSKSRTPVQTSAKKRSSTHRSHYIRLSPSVLKEKILNITAYKHQLYNMHFMVKKSTLIGETPAMYPSVPVFPDMNLTQLLYWPGIKLQIVLDHLSFNHEVRDNCERDIVFGTDILVNISRDRNPSQTRYLQQVPSSKKYPMVSKALMETYLKTLMEVAPFYDVGPSKVPEIQKTFGTVIDDITLVSRPSIQTRVTHSRFLNGHKYFRLFDNEAKSEEAAALKSSNKTNLKVRLREIINPEAIFSIPNCHFTTSEIDHWEEPLVEYFDKILKRTGIRIKELLRDRFKKCIMLKCEKCNEIFDGALWSVKLKDHIKQKHFINEDWVCVKCLRSYNQFELMQMGWNHNCSTGI